MSTARSDITVGILFGGTSREREVSIHTGEAMARAAAEAGYRVVSIDFAPERLREVLDAGIDVALLALHGGFGEAGSVQGLLNLAGIPYTGAGVMGSALAMDKVRAKRLCAAAGIRTPEYAVLSGARAAAVVQAVASGTVALGVVAPEVPSALLASDYVVKPSCEGSSVGVTIVMRHMASDDAAAARAFGDAVRGAMRGSDDVLVERYVAGPELSVGLFDGEVLGTVEIVPADGFYDYEAKYLSKTTEYRIPPRISDAARVEAEGLARQVFEVLGCRGIARIDFLLDAQDRPWLLELNTLPGMTETSLVPKLAAARGISFPDLVARMIESAKVDQS